jgi:hypothetical protein
MLHHNKILFYLTSSMSFGALTCFTGYLIFIEQNYLK